MSPWHCNTFQHTATHCSTLQHTAAHCNQQRDHLHVIVALQHVATHCKTLQHAATHKAAMDMSLGHCNTLHHTKPYCNATTHTAPHAQTMDMSTQVPIESRPLFSGVAAIPTFVAAILHGVAANFKTSPATSPSDSIRLFKILESQFCGNDV